MYIMQLAYRKLTTYESKITEKSLPDGIPGIRDVNAKCTGYAPRKLELGEFNSCESDGHYLCEECAFYQHHWQPTNPYLLSGDELKRTEDARKAGRHN